MAARPAILLIGQGAGLRQCAGLLARHDRLRLAGLVATGGAAAVRGFARQADAAVIGDCADRPAVIAAAAARGWPVLLTGPLPASLEEFDTEVAAAADTPVLVGLERRHHAAVGAARSLIASGAVGTLTAIQAQWALRQPRSLYTDERRLAARGGPAFAALVEEIDLLRHLGGEIAGMAALSSAHARRGPVEDAFALCGRFASGGLFTLLATDAALTPWGWEAAAGEAPGVAPTGLDCWQISGTEGAIGFPSLRLWRFEGDGQADCSRALSAIDLGARGEPPAARQLAHFADMVEAGAAPAVPFAQARASLAAALEARAAAAAALRDPAAPGDDDTNDGDRGPGSAPRRVPT
ncbi:hypothetical protein [Oceanicella sp. SM1341]|uniref:Gfo/Idh/MocA family protein n=1 Tax=Oceanicella sp. SM1341 TaxID=1548889 RepID=UPI00130035EC|nr:hypothetical protein [Oceanicella sp. SM1341]